MTATHDRARAAARRVLRPAVAVTVLLGSVGAAGAQEPTDTTSAPSSGGFSLTPSFVGFVDVVVGEEKIETVTVTAEGGVIEDIHASVDGPFTVVNNCVGLELDAGEQCPIDVHFAPAASGAVSGTLVVEVAIDDEASTLEASVDIGGNAIDPVSTTSPVPTDPPITGPPPVTTAPVPTGAPSTSTPVETREECDARALDAEITYTPELQMRVGESETVEVSASTGGGVVPATSVPSASTTVVPQPLRCQVRARLVGTDFAIEPDDWQVKSFLGTNQVSWLWLVTPNVTGDDLLLILQIQGLRFDPDAGTYVEAGEAFEDTAEIQVDSEPKGLLTRINDVITGIVTHPVFALLATTGALALIVGWTYRKMRGAPPSPPVEPAPAGPSPEQPPDGTP